jgi:hypothetical protein
MEADWGKLEAGLLRRCLDDIAVVSDCNATFGDYLWSESGYEWIWKFISSTYENTGEVPTPELLITAVLQVPGADGGDPPEGLLLAVERVISAQPERRHRAVRRVLLGRDAKRRAMSTIDRAVDRFSKGRDAEGLAELERAAVATSTDRRPTIKPLIPRTRNRLRKIERCPTGLHKLDVLLGGLGRGELGIAMGVAGVGKSTFGVNLGHAGIRAGWRVLHIDTEMGDLLTRARYISRFTGIPHDHIEEDKLSTAQRERLDGWLERNHERLASQLRVLYLGMYESSLADVDAAFTRTVLDGFSPDLLVFDSPDHLLLGGKGGVDMSARWAYFVELYGRLAGRALQYNIALWVLNQANETAAKGIATTKDIRDSQQKVKDASFVLSINRDPEALEDDTRRIVYVGKGRSKKSQFRVSLECDSARMLLRAPLDDPRLLAEVPFERV